MKYFIYTAVCAMVLIGQSVYGQSPYHFPRPEDFTSEILDPMDLVGSEIEHKDYPDLDTWIGVWYVALIGQGILASMDEVGVSTAEIGTDNVLAPMIFQTMMASAFAEAGQEKIIQAMSALDPGPDIRSSPASNAFYSLHGNSGAVAKIYIRIGVEYGLKMCLKTVGTYAYRSDKAISALVDRTYTRLKPLLPTMTTIEKISMQLKSAQSSSTNNNADK